MYLNSLTLSSGTLSPTFSNSTQSYTATVATTVSSGFTITATPRESNATVVRYLGATGTTAFTGALSIGENTIRVIVQSHSGTTSTSFTLVVTREAATALTPIFGAVNRTADGYTVPITNYSVSYTWGGSATASGSISFNAGTGVLTVSGVAPGTTSVATITTTRTGYTGGSATVSGTSITGAALNPTWIDIPSVNENGYTFQISNYSASYTWAGTATASGTVTISGTGLVTVTGTGPGKLSTTTITASRTGYATGSASRSATTLTIPATATFGKATDLSLVVIRAVYLQTNPIAANVNTPGKVTFLVNNLAIPGCTGVKTVGSGNSHTATCNYRPTSLGNLNITATITPTNTGYLPVTRSIKVIVSPK